METSQAEVIKKCRNDLQKERLIKSVLCGIAAGFAVMFVLAFITWIFEFKGLWLTLGLGVAAVIGATLLFYFVVFVFTDKEVMERIDRAGLDERMITMYQLQGDDSYMAQRQREDASAAFSAAVKKSGGRLIKTKIATAIICAASIACPLGTGMAVVTALSDYDVIPTLGAIGGGGFGFGGFGGNTTPTYTVTYKVDGETDGGSIKMNNSDDTAVLVSSSDGSIDTVEKGGSTFAKVKIERGYYVEKWVDEKGTEYDFSDFVKRYGSQPQWFAVDDVQKDMTVIAVIAKYPDNDELNFAYYCIYDPNGEPDPDHPRDPNDDKDGPEPNPEPPPSPGNGNGSGAGGRPTDPGNTIVDGETQYSENYEYYYNLAMEMMANGTEGYPPELVAIVEGYFGTL